MTNISKQSKGGLQRAENLTSEERKVISSNAAKARWDKELNLPKATHRGELEIGDIKISCAVLEDGTRLLSETGISVALSGGNERSGYARRKKSKEVEKGEPSMPIFMNAICLEPFIDYAFSDGPLSVIEYKDGRIIKTGYDAKILPKVCDVWLKARDAGVLSSRQLPKAFKAEILMRGLAYVGIVALVDEATGYQVDRDRYDLHKLLSVYLTNEKLKWAKRFPDEFYKQLYRLMNWDYPNHLANHPSYVGKLTNYLVYEKLPKGVLEELQVG